MKKLLMKFGLRILRRVLRSRKYKDLFIIYINQKVDIPKMDEKAERKLFDALYDNIVDALLSVVEHI